MLGLANFDNIGYEIIKSSVSCRHNEYPILIKVRSFLFNIQSFRDFPRSPVFWEIVENCLSKCQGHNKTHSLLTSRLARPCPSHGSKYQGGLFNKQELVWLNFCTRVYLMLCSYNKIIETTKNKISYFGFNCNRKSTF